METDGSYSTLSSFLTKLLTEIKDKFLIQSIETPGLKKRIEYAVDKLNERRNVYTMDKDLVSQIAQLPGNSSEETADKPAEKSSSIKNALKLKFFGGDQGESGGGEPSPHTVSTLGSSKSKSDNKDFTLSVDTSLNLSLKERIGQAIWLKHYSSFTMYTIQNNLLKSHST